jgi:hypothetical protein
MLNCDLSPNIWGNYLQIRKILDVHSFWLLESILQCQGPHLQSRPPPPLVIAGQASPWRCLGDGGAGQAQAFVVTVGGQDWDVTTFTGSYIVNTSKFGLPPAPGVMPWWGSASLAQQFVAATGGNLGSPPQTQGFSAPFFGYEQDVNVPTVTWAYSYFSGGPFPINADPITDEPTWAQATLLTPPAAPVPGPLPALGAAAAFGFSRKLRKRIKINKGSSATFTLL